VSSHDQSRELEACLRSEPSSRVAVAPEVDDFEGAFLPTSFSTLGVLTSDWSQISWIGSRLMGGFLVFLYFIFSLSGSSVHCHLMLTIVFKFLEG
jgi:hypothetical protein